MSVFKTPNGTELPILDLKGKDYLQVAWRIVWFREVYPMGRITTKCILRHEKYVVYKATVSVPLANFDYVVLADGVKREDYAHFPDAEEKASTGAIGRALANCGFGTAFCGSDLDEGERLADAPLEQKPQASKPFIKIPDFVKAAHPVSGDDPGQYVIDFGKYKGQKIIDIDQFQLNNYLQYLDKQAKSSGKPITGKVREFVGVAEQFLHESENRKNIHQDSPPWPDQRDEMPF